MVEDLKAKVETLKKEVEKAKQDIQDTYRTFEKHKYIYEKEHFKHLFCFKMTYTIKKEFINFLKETDLSKKIIKNLKMLRLIGITGYPHNDPNIYNKYYYKKEVVDQFKEALSMFDKYGSKYEEQQLIEQLCKYTDCLKKLKPNECKQCHSEVPKEASYCPQCGFQVKEDGKAIVMQIPISDPTKINGVPIFPHIDSWYDNPLQKKPHDTTKTPIKCPCFDECTNITKGNYTQCVDFYRFSEKCKYYKDTTTKETDKCPYAITKCRGYIESLCKDYIECVGYRRLKEEEKDLCESCKAYAKCDRQGGNICKQYEPQTGYRCWLNNKCSEYKQISEKCHNFEQLMKCEYYEKGGKK